MPERKAGTRRSSPRGRPELRSSPQTSIQFGSSYRRNSRLPCRRRSAGETVPTCMMSGFLSRRQHFTTAVIFTIRLTGISTTVPSADRRILVCPAVVGSNVPHTCDPSWSVTWVSAVAGAAVGANHSSPAVSVSAASDAPAVRTPARSSAADVAGAACWAAYQARSSSSSRTERTLGQPYAARYAQQIAHAASATAVRAGIAIATFQPMVSLATCRG